MKKSLRGFASLVLLAALVLLGCSNPTSKDSPQEEADSLLENEAVQAGLNTAAGLAGEEAIDTIAGFTLKEAEKKAAEIQAALDAYNALSTEAKGLIDAETEEEFDALADLLILLEDQIAMLEGNIDYIFKTDLIGAIIKANAAKSGVVFNTNAANVFEGTKWVTREELTTFNSAIAAAAAVKNKADVAQLEIDTAAPKLINATNTFNLAKKDGTKTEGLLVFTTAPSISLTAWVGGVLDFTLTASDPAADSYDVYWISGSETNVAAIKAANNQIKMTSLSGTISSSTNSQIFSVVVTARKAGYAGKDSVVVERTRTPVNIQMGVPKVEVDWARPNLTILNNLEVSTDGYLIGYASHAKGVASGYPRIQFWRDGESSPDPSVNVPDYHLNWSPMDVPAAADWPVGAGKSGKNLEFRYYTNVHTPTGEPAEPLSPGLYHLRILAKDVDGTVFVYPPPYANEYGTLENSLRITVSAPRELPKVELMSGMSNYKSDAFTLEAIASHSSGISSAELWVKDSAGADGWTQIQWEINREGTGLEGDGRTYISRTLKSFSIIPGGSYPKFISETDPPGIDPNYSFGDNGTTYDFEIRAVSLQGSRFTYPFTVFIDKERPAITVTSVSQVDPDQFPLYMNNKLYNDFNPGGAYSTWANVQSKVEDRYLVNGNTTVKLNVDDNNGISDRAIKFLVYEDHYGSNPPGPLTITSDNIAGYYADAISIETRFVINSDGTISHAKSAAELSAASDPQPWITGNASNVSQIAIDTTQDGTKGAAKYHLYVYFFVQDKAGNYGTVNASASGVSSPGNLVGLDLWVDPETASP